MSAETDPPLTPQEVRWLQQLAEAIGYDACPVCDRPVCFCAEWLEGVGDERHYGKENSK